MDENEKNMYFFLSFSLIGSFILICLITYYQLLDLRFIFNLFSKLSPFIIICFFTLQSMIKQDLKGIIYLAGVIFACTTNILFGNFPYLQKINTNNLPSSSYHLCRLIEFSSGPMSYIPLGLTILGFTMAYLMYNTTLYKINRYNYMTFGFLTCLIINDFYFNLSAECAKIEALIISLIIGIFTGILWGFTINTIGDPKLQLITGLNPNTTCYAPKNQKYRCKVK